MFTSNPLRTLCLICVITTGLMSRPIAAADMEWHAETFGDPNNKGRFTAALTYSIPETDAVQFRATCSAGSSGNFATTVIGYDTVSLAEEAEVRLDVLSQGSDQRLKGEVYGTQLEEGVSGVLRLGYDDGFWNELARRSLLRYRNSGMRTAIMVLRGSGKAVRKFIGDCKAISSASTAANTSGEQSAKNRNCDKFGKAKSQSSETPVTVAFVNRTDSHRSVMWIDFEGAPVHYADLGAGETHTIRTFETHPWMFTDGPGNCIEMFMPRQGDSKFEITATSPYFGPEND